MSPFLWATSSFQKNNIALPKVANLKKSSNMVTLVLGLNKELFAVVIYFSKLVYLSLSVTSTPVGMLGAYP
jgi:hypothetical protein